MEQSVPARGWATNILWYWIKVTNAPALEELLGADLSQLKLINLKEKPAQHHSQSWPETWLVSPLLLAHNLHTLIPDPSDARVVSLR